MHYKKIIDFWFEEIDPKLWWLKDPGFDQQIKDRFGQFHRAASQCELYVWREDALGRVAEIIILDQFSRNIYRNTPLAFAQDALALCLAQEAISNKADQALIDVQKAFLYMPFMHSESKLVHEQAVRLFKQAGLENNLDYEHKHKSIIDRFGRYPHRNKILGRPSTPEELAFLQQPGSSF